MFSLYPCNSQICSTFVSVRKMFVYFSHVCVYNSEHSIYSSSILHLLSMAGILQNVFTKGIYSLKDPENVSKIKTLVNHSALYFGLIIYTAVGAKVETQIKQSWQILFSRFFNFLSCQQRWTGWRWTRPCWSTRGFCS